jgi:hypothetical protein
MPQKCARFCGKCHRTAEPGSPPRCAMHQATPGARGSVHGSRHPAYNTVVWRKWTRQAVLSRDAICAFIVNGSRCVRLANQIHHIIPWEEWVAAGNDFNDIQNLCGLCKGHHDVIRHMPFSLDVLALPWKRGKGD